VNLVKKSVGMGIVLWWSRVFEGDHEEDVTKFPDRAGASDSFQKNWSEATEAFKEKVKSIVPEEIEC